MPTFQISAIFARFRSDDFDDRYSFPERRRRELARRDSAWRRQLDWVRRQPWPLRIVIVLAAITTCYLAAIAGLVLGLFLRGLMVS